MRRHLASLMQHVENDSRSTSSNTMGSNTARSDYKSFNKGINTTTNKNSNSNNEILPDFDRMYEVFSWPVVSGHDAAEDVEDSPSKLGESGQRNQRVSGGFLTAVAVDDDAFTTLIIIRFIL